MQQVLLIPIRLLIVEKTSLETFCIKKCQCVIYGEGSNSLNVMGMDRDEIVSTVTSSCDLPLKGQRSKY